MPWLATHRGRFPDIPWALLIPKPSKVLAMYSKGRTRRLYLAIESKLGSMVLVCQVIIRASRTEPDARQKIAVLIGDLLDEQRKEDHLSISLPNFFHNDFCNNIHFIIIYLGMAGCKI